MEPADSPQFQPWMRQSVSDALLAVGCPADTADRLAREARIEWSRESWPGAGDGEWLLRLQENGAGLGRDLDRDDWAGAAGMVAENVAGHNAEANDRQKRGEDGWTPLWLLPDRPSRR